MNEVLRALGPKAFKKYDDQREKSISEGLSFMLGIKHPIVQSRESLFAGMTEEALQGIVWAYKRYFCSKRIASLFVPLFALGGRDKLLYAVERAPWPSNVMPQNLVHLAKKGFEDKPSWGILAYPPSSTDAWLVEKFSQGKVDAKIDRIADNAAAFPSLMSTMSEILNRLIKNDALLASAVAEARRAADNFDRMEARITKSHASATIAKPTKPKVIFSDHFLSVNCNSWARSESRSRKRCADAILRRLFENWRDSGNAPISLDDLLADLSDKRLEKVLNPDDKYPYTWGLIRIRKNNRTGGSVVCLRDDCEYVLS